MGGVGAFPGLAHEDRSATLELSSCTGTAPSPPGKVPRAPWWRWSGLAPPHSQVTHTKRKKKWVRHMQRGKSIGIRQKREESRISHSCLTGSQLASQKGKKKSPGVNASGGGCVCGRGVGGDRGTREIYYCLWQPPREPRRGAEARGGGGGGQRTIRST